MDDTPNLGLPYIMAAQSQKHVTHNEAIRALDAMVQLAVLDRDLSAPPGSPAEGARYIVGSSPTGAWSGHADEVAAYQDGAWMLYAPVEGWIAWIGDEDIAVVWDGTVWSALTTGSGGGTGSFTTLGINATADTTNRLTLAADATLLNHDGDGHQLKINKASASDTASLLYQDAFSGRAEHGLAGDDDFHFKVSPDGSTWKEAIVISRSSGVVTFPFTSLSGGREVLTGNRTYYVRADGSDANTGLVNSSGGAFLTRQKAFDVIKSTLDVAGYTVTVQIVDGSYSGSCDITAWVGGGAIVIQGNSGTPANVTITSAANCYNIDGPLPGRLTIKDQKLVATGSCFSSRAAIWHFGNIDFGASNLHFELQKQTIALCDSNYTISGGALIHWYTESMSMVYVENRTITITGTPAFSLAFAYANQIAFQSVWGNTFAGSATGARYNVSQNAIITSAGAGASYLPGNASGSSGSQGQYL